MVYRHLKKGSTVVDIRAFSCWFLALHFFIPKVFLISTSLLFVNKMILLLKATNLTICVIVYIENAFQYIVASLVPLYINDGLSSRLA